jgi:hypothetical protein
MGTDTALDHLIEAFIALLVALAEYIQSRRK